MHIDTPRKRLSLTQTGWIAGRTTPEYARTHRNLLWVSAKLIHYCVSESVNVRIVVSRSWKSRVCAGTRHTVSTQWRVDVYFYRMNHFFLNQISPPLAWSQHSRGQTYLIAWSGIGEGGGVQLMVLLKFVLYRLHINYTVQYRTLGRTIYKLNITGLSVVR